MQAKKHPQDDLSAYWLWHGAGEWDSRRRSHKIMLHKVLEFIRDGPARDGYMDGWNNTEKNARKYQFCLGDEPHDEFDDK